MKTDQSPAFQRLRGLIKSKQNWARGSDILAAIKDALNRLPPESLLAAITAAVDGATCGGEGPCAGTHRRIG